MGFPRTPGENVGGKRSAGLKPGGICLKRLISLKNKLENPTPTNGPGGVLLSVPVGAPEPGDTWRWGWTHINQWGEPEMLQEGTRTGVTVSREGCE